MGDMVDSHMRGNDDWSVWDDKEEAYGNDERACAGMTIGRAIM